MDAAVGHKSAQEGGGKAQEGVPPREILVLPQQMVASGDSFL